MKKDHILIPTPRSTFQKIICAECDEEQVVFSHNTTEVICNSCGNVLAMTKGSKSRIHGKISEASE